ncbi:hypothetical protein [uncultured Muribaculum sp.]|uniref:hypothetical protein n=1 Tax=uncultured Muribaculum sp. TaxID=1918613 RepID=UPI0025844A58|nr:hypothetical protein [uncultured Muribaculum sp.]
MISGKICITKLRKNCGVLQVFSHDDEFFFEKKPVACEPFLPWRVLVVHSKITFSIARNVIMIGLLTGKEIP